MSYLDGLDRYQPESMLQLAYEYFMFGGDWRVTTELPVPYRFEYEWDIDFTDYRPHVFWFWRALGSDGDHAISTRVFGFLHN